MLKKKSEQFGLVSTDIIRDNNYIANGFYAYPGRIGRKNVIKHVIRCYHEATYMLRGLITQFETLEASVAQIPLAKTIMSERIASLKQSINIIENEKIKLTVLLEEKKG